NDKNPLRDRTIQEHYSPGSTFKLITAIAAMEEGIVDENTLIPCKGVFRSGRRNFHCWRWSGHGKVNVVQALRESCDVYFYKIATKLDIDILARYARLFGLGRKTGVGLPRETTGLIPTKEWKKKRNGKDWHQGETLSCAIGQSYILTTPIQLALTYAVIANGGKLFKPRIIKEIFSNSGEIKQKDEPEVVSQIDLGTKTLAYVKRGLYEAVNTRKGTAWHSRGENINMAGKTGTSQVIRMSAEKLFSKCEENEYKHRHHALFVGYAPEDKPEVAVSVVVEHGCQGSKVAAPIARDIITTYMNKYHHKLKKVVNVKEGV
ncbi:MAG: penicillin-binding transpeptidase domain-containing protein, partial [Halobacteriovoraceae bacterium]|nr:penicillin-binding transpeptidase domain-containing protein [Halobacteriovoraceae bacterium]